MARLNTACVKWVNYLPDQFLYVFYDVYIMCIQLVFSDAYKIYVYIQYTSKVVGLHDKSI